MKDYYRQVAEIVLDEMSNPRDDENYPDFIRLTSKDQLETVTREDGDVFQWLKEQARNNVMEAHVSNQIEFIHSKRITVVRTLVLFITIHFSVI